MIPLQHDAHVPSPRRRGRPILGGVSGFFLGVFVWLDMILLGALPLESGVGYVFPVLGVALGIGLAMWAPFGTRSETPAPMPSERADVASADVDAAEPHEDQPSTSTTSDGA